MNWQWVDLSFQISWKQKSTCVSVSKLLSNLSEIIIISDSLTTSRVIKSITVSSFSQFLHVMGEQQSPFFLKWCPVLLVLHTQGWGEFSNWRAEPGAVSWSWDPFRAATGEDLFVPTSEFSAENNENPRVCPEVTKLFASVEKWTTI